MEDGISKVYENAKIKLDLTVEMPDQDVNIVNIGGNLENLKKIFKGIYDGLASRDHPIEEIERDWNEISKGEQLRPGGTFMVTLKSKGREQPELLIMNVNSKNYAPIVNEMHDAISNSITNAAENL